MTTVQLDMFGQPLLVNVPTKRAARARAPSSRPVEMEDMAQALEASGLYRITRKLLRPVVSTELRPGFPRIGLVVDTETTGLNHRVDEVIEIGVVAFSYDDDGQFGDIIGTYGALQYPGRPIPADITLLTGISDEMVTGQAIDQLKLDHLVAPADLVIAHNAGFDRPFCEKLSPAFEQKAWACSVKEIDWKARGFEGTKLGYLIGQSGYFHDGHRAIDDCYALLEILCRPSGEASTPAFEELLQSSLRSRVRIWAEHSPFDMKERLKARRYRWSDGSDGKPKSWWTEVDEGDVEAELEFLRAEIYGRADVEPVTSFLTAAVRYKA